MKFAVRNMYVGICAFLAAVSIGFATTNSISITLFPLFRYAFLVVVLIYFILYHGDGRINLAAAYSLCLMIFFYCYAFGLSIFYLVDSYSFYSMLESFVVVFLGVFFMSISRKIKDDRIVSRVFLLYAGLVFLFLFATGGFVISGVPRFHYDMQTELGSEIRYRQGISSFFGMAAICCLLLIPRGPLGFWCLFYALLFTVNLALSFIGGGRGEIILLALISMFIALSNRNVGFVLVGLTIAVTVAFKMTNGLSILSELTSFNRFLVIFQNSDFGSRDLLFGQALDLIFSEASCFTFGCGYAYFQYFFEYKIGWYPHNIFLEAMITWGFPLSFLFLLLVVYGYVKEGSRNVPAILGMYFVLIGFKSGNVLSSWLALAFLYYHAGVGLMHLLSRVTASNKKHNRRT